MTASNTPLAGVIGSPISQSKSPLVHGTWLKRHGIKGHYIPMQVSQEDLAEALVMLPRLGFVGLNVTIPHKERILDLADVVTDRAAIIGAANTIIFQENGRIHADNTDGYGFIKNIEQNAPDWQPGAGPAMVFGAGGAARAIIVSLLEAGAPEILLTNRTRPRAEGLKKEFGAKITVVDWVKAAAAVADASTVVNTTSMGMTGQSDFNISLDKLSSSALVTDLVYQPLKTTFLATAESKGCTVVDGLGMLLHQAVPGFERWFGVRPVVDEELRNIVLDQ